MPNDVTPTELREAAERRRKWQDGTHHPSFDYTEFLFDVDAERLADAYLREHPADDDEPADLDFAEELLGPLSINGVLGVRAGMLHYSDDIEFRLRTRRDVRDLLRLLKGTV